MTPPTDYKKLAEGALGLIPSEVSEFPRDTYYRFLRPLARAVLTLDAENKRQSDLRQVAVEMRVRTDKADARLYAENQRLRAALEFYAKPELWRSMSVVRRISVQDGGVKAREALERK